MYDLSAPKPIIALRGGRLPANVRHSALLRWSSRLRCVDGDGYNYSCTILSQWIYHPFRGAEDLINQVCDDFPMAENVIGVMIFACCNLAGLVIASALGTCHVYPYTSQVALCTRRAFVYMCHVTKKN